MSFISTLTWSCIELQSFIENPDVKEEEKKNLILKHLISLEEDSSRDVFPEFESGLSSTLFLNKSKIHNYLKFSRVGMV